ncbi:ribosomal RNA processing protein 36-like [Tropilaelaps mercedesae]|uniref:rRNA biogenesis protein RRP36 n=1 Tax=Tropilaelaps mercedesae TaxID=418985 RepID=A0A1V9Y2H9_9ACAR|nr:ribosomal RNA processing protein 36-like [Tropilaelaps mercedesae]
MADEESSNSSQSDYDSGSDREDIGGDGEDRSNGLANNNLLSDLKGQSFEEILALKDQVGLRTYKTAIGLEEFGNKKRKKVFKRDNKNRPREVSSKLPVAGVRNIFNVKKKIRADPRFEAGFDEVQPRNNIKAQHKAKQRVKDYAFIDKIREEERKQIKQGLAEGELVGADALKARKLLQKAQSREVSRRQKNIQKELNDKYTAFLQNAKQAGEQVKYMTKREKRQAELIVKFNELKKSGKLEKYLEKKRKKNAAQDRKKMHKSSA